MSSLFEIPFLGRGFRPFFMLGALYAGCIVLLWGLVFQGSVHLDIVWEDIVLWHAHEMIYGFTVAIVAGFLLTAVANWTGGAPARHIHLAALCIVWLLGRILFWIPDTPLLLLSIVDLSFIPFLAISLAIPLFKARNIRNLMFIALLTLLFAGNLYMHLSAMGKVTGDVYIVSYVSVLTIMMIISIISSRIIPAFTVAARRRCGEVLYQTDQRKTDIAALFLLFMVTIFGMFLGFNSLITGICSLFAGGIHLYRMRFWHSLKTFSDPLLWILHVGHLWLVLGLFLLGLYGLGFVEQRTLPLHILTVGSIGSMIIGMIPRVSMGHTGRELKVGSLIVFSFYLIQASVIIRSVAIIMSDTHYSLLILCAGVLWFLAFIIYFFSFFRILISPRPDGKTS